MTASQPAPYCFVSRDIDGTALALGAGNLDDISRIREWCQALPGDAFGNVFIVTDGMTDDAINALELTVPAGVCVTLLAGERLLPALNAWLDEWIRANPRCGNDLLLWRGARTTDSVPKFWAGVASELATAWSGPQLPPGVTRRRVAAAWRVPENASALVHDSSVDDG